jgi:thiol-disulfide isomerase/thioredoxin
MKRARKYRISSLFAVVITLLSVAGAAARGDAPGRVPAPDFTLKSASGENLKLSELRGQVVLVNFWASWCGPCRQEMPLLDQLHRKYGPLGFTVLGVNVDGDPRQATAFLEKVPVTFPVVFDSGNAVSKSYEVVAMPTTLIVDRGGDVRYLHKGYASGIEAEYQQQVRLLLAERR